MTDRESADQTADLYRALLEREARLESLMEQLLERERQRESATKTWRQSSRETDKGSIRLTEREAQIIHLLAAGQTNRQIGQQLQLATGTVRNYLGRIFRKLGVTTRTQAAVLAVELGLTTPPSGSTARRTSHTGVASGDSTHHRRRGAQAAP